MKSRGSATKKAQQKKTQRHGAHCEHCLAPQHQIPNHFFASQCWTSFYDDQVQSKPCNDKMIKETITIRIDNMKWSTVQYSGGNNVLLLYLLWGLRWSLFAFHHSYRDNLTVSKLKEEEEEKLKSNI